MFNLSKQDEFMQTIGCLIINFYFQVTLENEKRVTIVGFIWSGDRDKGIYLLKVLLNKGKKERLQSYS